MAGGFWKGLLHGAVVSVVGLGALSLLTPVTHKDEAPESDAGRGAGLSESAPSPARQNPEAEIEAVAPDDETGDVSETEEQPDSVSVDQADAPDEGDDGGAPRAATVELPSGSEFGRGSDAAPQTPAALPPHARRGRPSPLAATAPADEPATARELPADLQPDAGTPAQSELPEPEAAPEFGLPEAQTAPSGGEAPGLAGLEAPDSLPETAPPQLAEPQIEEQDGPADQDQSSDMAGQDAGQENATPVLPAPSLDLSTPPDLSELRALERD
ncbi:hypothetical protein [Paracoccus onubensis]|uniref:Uncharacterized protein n=1 Tax=Paracoccus onubensis TaxID=1675788 RepID=A0A418SS84_9RHOB|nr:hypothetical protein [Paracoccus onubensis]RJE83772.1 hypothetical protein D3P04_15365 [Paracoccus onubensis]